jgi:hypothetical protein
LWTAQVTTRILYLIACAAPPARRLNIPIRAAQNAGWDVCAILTPSAYRWASEDAEGEIASVDTLRAAGINLLLGEGGFTPHKPRHGDLDAYPWQAAVDALPT